MPDQTSRPWAPAPLGGNPPLIINVALTGAVPSKSDSAAVPITPEEIVDDAIACARAGASIVHVHVRDEEGRPVHRADLYERVFGPLRDAVPELVLCGTTSGRVSSEIGERMTVLELDPALRPDMASVTLGSFNFPRSVSNNPPEVIRGLLAAIAERGMKPELEVFELGMVNTLHALIDEGFVRGAPYVNILLGSLGSAPAFAGDLGRMVERLPQGSEWAGAGIGVFQRAITMTAIAMGGNVRTGLEDAPRDVDGSPSSNVAAVERAVAAAHLAGRAVATPAETRARLGLVHACR